MAHIREFTKGLLAENPVFVLVLGLCPTLAVTTSVENAIGMGAAATFVLLMSNILVSILRSFIPSKIRIPAYIVVIASFVTIVELMMHGYAPQLYAQLGIFVPLIVVNCIILAARRRLRRRTACSIRFSTRSAWDWVFPSH
jgi:electron transport complex protein RnfE